MRPRPAWLIVPFILLPTSSCADESRIREVACQQRLVDAGSDIRAVRGADRTIIGPTFARVAKSFEDIKLDGCTENQTHNAKALARLAGELAASAGSAESAIEKGEPGLQEQQAFLMFADRLERFEKRRHALRDELARMTAEER